MPIYLWILTIIFFVLLIFFFMPLTIRIQIKKDQRDDRISLSFKTLFGLLNYKLEIPIINWILSLQQEPVLKVDAKTNINLKTHSKKQNFFDLKEINCYQNKMSRILERYYKVMRYISKKIVIEFFQWRTTLGTGDAAITGTIIGVVWIIKGILISILQNYIHCEEVDIMINPNFQQQGFITNLDSIIHIKIGHIIIAALKVSFIFIIKGGEGNGKSSN